jgi:hypothetical protein
MKTILSVIAASTLVISGPLWAQPSDGSIATGIDFEFEASLMPVLQKYSGCVDPHRPLINNGNPSLTAATEAGIAACKAARAAAMLEADAILAKQRGWESKTKRDAEIVSDFDNTDASARKVARETDAHFHIVNQ